MTAHSNDNALLQQLLPESPATALSAPISLNHLPQSTITALLALPLPTTVPTTLTPPSLPQLPSPQFSSHLSTHSSNSSVSAHFNNASSTLSPQSLMTATTTTTPQASLEIIRAVQPESLSPTLFIGVPPPPVQDWACVACHNVPISPITPQCCGTPICASCLQRKLGSRPSDLPVTACLLCSREAQLCIKALYLALKISAEVVKCPNV